MSSIEEVERINEDFYGWQTEIVNRVLDGETIKLGEHELMLSKDNNGNDNSSEIIRSCTDYAITQTAEQILKSINETGLPVPEALEEVLKNEYDKYHGAIAKESFIAATNNFPDIQSQMRNIINDFVQKKADEALRERGLI